MGAGVTTMIGTIVLQPGQWFAMVAIGFERRVAMMVCRMVIHRPRRTACQREQQEPNCEQAS